MDIKYSLRALLILTAFSPVVFATVQEGEEAYRQHRYEKAYLLLSEEADKGNASAQ